MQSPFVPAIGCSHTEGFSLAALGRDVNSSVEEPRCAVMKEKGEALNEPCNHSKAFQLCSPLPLRRRCPETSEGEWHRSSGKARLAPADCVNPERRPFSTPLLPFLQYIWWRADFESLFVLGHFHFDLGVTLLQLWSIIKANSCGPDPVQVWIQPKFSIACMGIL